MKDNDEEFKEVWPLTEAKIISGNQEEEKKQEDLD